jgi:hypothetical protein
MDLSNLLSLGSLITGIIQVRTRGVSSSVPEKAPEKAQTGLLLLEKPESTRCER